MEYRIIHTLTFGPITLYTYGLCFALAFLSGIFISLALAKKRSFNLDHIWNLILLIFLGGVLGARIGFFVAHPTDLTSISLFFKLWTGGMAFYGGFLGALLAAWGYIKYKKLDFYSLADLFTPGLAIGYGFVRLGSFLNGEHMGKPTSFFLGVVKDGVRYHQTTIYSIVYSVLMLFISLFLWRRKLKPGVVFFTFLLTYSIYRPIIDAIRIDEPHFYYLTGSQWVSILVFLISIYFLTLRKERNGQNY